MTPEARRALHLIRECVAADRYLLAIHFARRMEERGLFWPDVQAVIDDPVDAGPQGLDKHARAKWIIRGEATSGEEIAIVCAIEIDETETEFITIYWEN